MLFLHPFLLLRGDTCWNYIGIGHTTPPLHPWLPVSQVDPQHEEKKTFNIY